MGYREMIRCDSPSIYWRQGETTGTTAADSSGSGRAGTYSGAVTLGQPGVIASDADTCVRYTGNGGNPDTGSSVLDYAPGIATPGDWSAEAWAMPNSRPATLGCVLCAADSSDAQQILLCYLPDGTWLGRGGNTDSPVSPLAYATGAWYYLAIVYSTVAGTYTLYVNGAQVASVALTTAQPTAARRLRVGGYNGSNYPGTNVFQFDGLIDEVAVYQSALSPAQVRRHYTEGLASAGLKRPWAA